MARIIPCLILILVVAACSKAAPTPTGPPTAPTGLHAVAGDAEVELRWTANPEADLEAYILNFRAGQARDGQEKTVPALANQTTVTNLLNDVSYHFTLQARNTRGQLSESSAVVEATPFKEVPTTSPPAQPQGLKAATGDSVVMLSWTANTESDLASYTLYWGADASDLGQTKELTKKATTTTVTGLENGTPYYFALEAGNSAGQASLRSSVISATPELPMLAPRIGGVSIEGYDLSTQVRQGAGDITLMVTGANLADVTTAGLGEFELNVLSATATEVRLGTTVLHGQALGFEDLTLVNAAGAGTFLEAIEVTPITVMKLASFNPDDVSGLGTANRPFLTLAKALSVASGSDTIYLGNGLYKEGERWPQEDGHFPPKALSNMPSGITLEGQGGGVVLVGPGRSAPYAGLVFADGGTVKNVTLQGFRRGILLTNRLEARLTLESVRVLEGYTGLFAANAKEVMIGGSEFYGQFDPQVGDGVGIYVIGSTELTIRDSTANQNGDGLALEGQARADLSRVALEENEQTGLYIRGAYAVVTDSSIRQNAHDGVYLDIKEGLFGREGFEMRGSTVANNGRHGLSVQGAHPFVDLGYGSDPGRNRVFGNSGFQLFDDRTAGSVPDITLVGSALGGVTLTGGRFVSGKGGREFTEAGIHFWRINQANNALVFDP